jgi:hypothetical protein
MTVMIFPFLALGLVVAAALSRIGMKMVVARRARPIAEHPESNWDQRQRELGYDRDLEEPVYIRQTCHDAVDKQQERSSIASVALVGDLRPHYQFRADDRWPRGRESDRRVNISDEISDRLDGLARLCQGLDRLLRSPTPT